jgi:hypothetical protein
VFNKVKSQQLRNMAEELAIIGEEEPDSAFSTYTHFAKCLSVLMRIELARRSNADESVE